MRRRELRSLIAARWDDKAHCSLFFPPFVPPNNQLGTSVNRMAKDALWEVLDKQDRRAFLLSKGLGGSGKRLTSAE